MGLCIAAVFVCLVGIIRPAGCVLHLVLMAKKIRLSRLKPFVRICFSWSDETLFFARYRRGQSEIFRKEM